MSKRLIATTLVLATCAVSSTALADDARSDTGSNTKEKTTQKADKKDTTTKKKQKGAVEEATKTTEGAGEDVSKAIVGEEQHEKNVREARKPRPKDKKDHKAAEDIGEATTTAAEAVINAGEAATRATDQPGKYNPLALELSPLGLFVGGRLSVQAEFAPATHHVILVSPHFVNTSSDVAISPDARVTQTFTGVGAELGYRYYTGRKGMNGVFVGPSIIGGVFNGSLPNGDQGFTNIGLAVDVGIQEVFADHFVLGGGLGLEYLHVSHDFDDLSAGPATIASTGVKPRFLLAGGYAF